MSLGDFTCGTRSRPADLPLHPSHASRTPELRGTQVSQGPAGPAEVAPGGSTAARGGQPDSGGVPGGPPLLALAPILDTLFLAAPVASKGSLIQYAGRILRSYENKTTAEVHYHLDERTGVLAAMLARRASGYTGLGFPTHASSH